MYPDGKYIFRRILRWPTPIKPPLAVGIILDSSGLAAIFTGIEFDGLFYLQHFAGKRPGYALRKSGHQSSTHQLILFRPNIASIRHEGYTFKKNILIHD
jgi:hypothetical protein